MRQRDLFYATAPGMQLGASSLALLTDDQMVRPNRAQFKVFLRPVRELSVHGQWRRVQARPGEQPDKQSTTLRLRKSRQSRDSAGDHRRDGRR